MNSSSTVKTILFWMSIALLAVMLWKLVSANGEQARVDQPSYSEFMAKVEAGEVKEVTMHLGQVSYELHGEYIRPANRKFQVTIAKEDAADVTKELRDKDVQIKFKEHGNADWVLLLLNGLPLLLLVGFCVFLMSQQRVEQAKLGELEDRIERLEKDLSGKPQ